MGIDAIRFIEKAMEENNVSSSALARRCGCSRQEIYRRMHSRMSLDTFADTVEALGYRLAVMWTEDGKQKGKPLPKKDDWSK